MTEDAQREAEQQRLRLEKKRERYVWYYLAYFLFGIHIVAFVMIYASGFAGGGVIAGIRLGILLEIAAIGMRLGFYAVQPVPGKLISYGSVSGLIEMIIVGAMVGAIYKPTAIRSA